LNHELPGRWKCQRYYNGVVEPRQYTWVKGICQRDPAPIRTGSDWSHPSYIESASPPCACASQEKFDRSGEWCTGTPSCTWYPHNVDTECGKTVDDLIKVVKTPMDPTIHFHSNQACIAKASCDLRCKMENCNWLKFVLRDFVNPYLQKNGDWSTIEARCRARKSNWFNDRLCAESMARHHIFNDLLPALVKHGCGSEADWKQVFGVIAHCSQRTFNGGMEKTLASAPVYLYRQLVRRTCTDARNASGLSTDINNDIRGKTCMP
jgi:hypothetical protein